MLGPLRLALPRSVGCNASIMLGEGALTAYEQERKARIESNQRLFQSLGLDAAAEAASARRSRPPRKRSRASGEGMDDDGERRRSARGLERGARQFLDSEEEQDPVAEQHSAAATPAGARAGAEKRETEQEGEGRRARGGRDSSAEDGARRNVRPLVFSDVARAAGSSYEFAERVRQVVQAIPVGRVASYGQCAALAGRPNNARQVGKLLALGLASGGDLPWQRVINSSGGISLPFAAGGATQKARLQAEGVVFSAAGKVSADFFWDPDSDDDAPMPVEGSV